MFGEYSVRVGTLALPEGVVRLDSRKFGCTNCALGWLVTTIQGTRGGAEFQTSLRFCSPPGFVSKLNPFENL